MSKYIHEFENKSDFETAYYGSAYEEPWVSGTPIQKVISFYISGDSQDGETLDNDFSSDPYGPYDYQGSFEDEGRTFYVYRNGYNEIWVQIDDFDNNDFVETFSTGLE